MKRMHPQATQGFERSIHQPSQPVVATATTRNGVHQGRAPKVVERQNFAQEGPDKRNVQHLAEPVQKAAEQIPPIAPVAEHHLDGSLHVLENLQLEVVAEFGRVVADLDLSKAQEACPRPLRRRRTICI